jgi:hypothetical protein
MYSKNNFQDTRTMLNTLPNPFPNICEFMRYCPESFKWTNCDAWDDEHYHNYEANTLICSDSCASENSRCHLTILKVLEDGTAIGRCDNNHLLKIKFEKKL